MTPERIPWESEPKTPKRNVPGDIEESTVDATTVDVRKLMSLTEGHPVLKQPLKKYLNSLTMECWVDSSGNTVAPKTIIDSIVSLGFEGAKDKHPEYRKHIEQIETTDYSYPIHVYEGNVLNGMHRLSKIVLEKQMGTGIQDFVTVKELKEIPREAITTRGLLKDY